MPSIRDIIDTIEACAPLALQETWDNSGVQVGDVDMPCTGVMLAVDHSPEVVAEAVAAGCNLVVSHHPIIFKPLRQLVGKTPAEKTVIAAIRANVTLYSAHTSMDNAPGGVSFEMARRLGLDDITVLSPAGGETGSGVVGKLRGGPVNAARFVAQVKECFDAPVARCSIFGNDTTVQRVALCGGAGGSFINDAIAAKADAYITADIRYHDFQERHNDILIVDLGHFETEECTKSIFYRLVSEKFPNFAVRYSKSEKNTILYL
ncbi:MAG: Nif3-like dinuclear metal center hexameric protein [Muribaculaceae bacterium]|nr:Nif3-like dinuclear metal center hexameric protein [Muribaculaceae bacterium]